MKSPRYYKFSKIRGLTRHSSLLSFFKTLYLMPCAILLLGNQKACERLVLRFLLASSLSAGEVSVTSFSKYILSRLNPLETFFWNLGPFTAPIMIIGFLEFKSLNSFMKHVEKTKIYSMRPFIIGAKLYQNTVSRDFL